MTACDERAVRRLARRLYWRRELRWATLGELLIGGAALGGLAALLEHLALVPRNVLPWLCGGIGGLYAGRRTSSKWREAVREARRQYEGWTKAVREDVTKRGDITAI